MLAACVDHGPPLEPAAAALRLRRAGYRITDARPPYAIAKLAERRGVTGGGCFDAVLGASIDTFCVVLCRDSWTCARLLGETGETYGDWQRGASLIVHVRCGVKHGAIDCVSARSLLAG